MKKIIISLIALIVIAGSGMAKVDYTNTYNMYRAYEEAGKENYTEALSFFDKEIVENPKNGYAYLGKAAGKGACV